MINTQMRQGPLRRAGNRRGSTERAGVLTLKERREVKGLTSIIGKNGAKITKKEEASGICRG